MFWLNEYFVAFGKVVATKLEGAAKAILENVEAHEGDSSSAEPQFGPIGRYARALPPVDAASATGLNPAGEAEFIGLRLGDNIHQIGAYRDLRLNAQVNPAEGAIGDAHYGGGFIEQSWNGDKNGTTTTIYAPRKDSGGSVVKAHLIQLDTTEAGSSVVVAHEGGASVALKQDGSVLVTAKGGGAFVEIKESGDVVISGTSISVTGGVNLGDKDPANTQFVALANLVLSELQAIKTWADSHTHTYNPGPSAPAQTGTAPPMVAPSSVAATVTKAK